MIGHLRVKSPLSQLGIFLGFFGASFVLASLLMAMVAMLMNLNITTADRLDWSDPGVLSAMKIMQAVSSVLIFFLPAVFFAVFSFYGRPFYFLGIRRAQHRSQYWLGIVAVMAAFPFAIWLGELNGAIPLPEWMTSMESDANKQMQAFLQAKTFGEVLINVLVIAVLPAVCEEFCFRGALQRIVIQLVRSPWLGILLTAIFFSALHLQFQGFLPRMFLGVVLGALFWYSASLWTSIIAHFVYNAVQVVAVSYMPEYVDRNPEVPLLMALCSGIAVWSILWIYRARSTVSYESVYESEGLNRHNQFIA